MLTIEKVIKLLDESHLAIFKQHLKESAAEYPLKLVNSIHRDILMEQTSNELCSAVYGDSNEKSRKKFFQLAHHTFRLTTFLSRNYPYYLLASVSRVQTLINSGKPTEAHSILETTRELAEKIEDHKTLIIILEMLSQEARISESYHEALKYREDILKTIKLEQQQSEIYCLLNEIFHPKQKPNETKNPKEIATIFTPYIESKSFAVSILGKYGYCYAFYLQNQEYFYSQKTLDYLSEIEDLLGKYNYIVFPYLENLSYKVSYLKIRHLFHSMETSLLIKESKQFIDSGNHTLFWNSFVNMPELFAIAFQTSFYTTHNFVLVGDEDKKRYTEEAKPQVEKLKRRCEELLENPGWNDQFILKLINLKTIYSLLLLLGEDKDDVKKSIQNLEMTLIEYQQIPFHFHKDSIFTSIIVGYFSLGDYENVVNCYKRYKKISDDNTINSENDITIHGFYYASQWANTQRKQYANKFKGILENTNKPNLQSTRKLLFRLAKKVGLDQQATEQQ